MTMAWMEGFGPLLCPTSSIGGCGNSGALCRLLHEVQRGVHVGEREGVAQLTVAVLLVGMGSILFHGKLRRLLNRVTGR